MTITPRASTLANEKMSWTLAAQLTLQAFIMAKKTNKDRKAGQKKT